MIRPSGPCPAKIMIVGDMPGEADVRTQLPLNGYAGEELSKMLSEAGIFRSMCFVSSVLREQLPSGRVADSVVAQRKADITANHQQLHGKWVEPDLIRQLALLQREIELCQPNVIITLGQLPLFALTGEWGIASWRGSELLCKLPLALSYQPKVLPTYHPSSISQVWERRPVVVQDLRRARRESLSVELTLPEYKFVLRPSFQQAMSVLHSLLAQLLEARAPMQLSCDIETRLGHITCIAFAWSSTEAICVPFLTTENPDGYWAADEEFRLVALIRQILENPMCSIVGQNFSSDAQYIFRHWLCRPHTVYDTMIAQHVCFAGMEKNLGYLSSMYCDHHRYWKDDGKEWQHGGDELTHWNYNCEDAARTYECAQVLRSITTAQGLDEVQEFQQTLFHPVLKTMLRGVRIDKGLKAGMGAELSAEIAKRELWIQDLLGHALNTKSAPQMKTLFYDQFREKPVLKRKGREHVASCDDEALRKIANREPLLRPLVNKIAELRSLNVFRSTFVNANLDIDNRMRCSYNIAGTDTYRFASSKNAFGSGLNMQNIPNGGGGEDELELPNVRKLFIPDPDMEFFDIDLSSADLRIVVWESDEDEMKDMLRQGLDPYTEIAKEHYRDPSITKKDPRRQKFKGFAHGTNYLGTAKGLAERMGLSVHEAEKTQKWYFQRFPRIAKWQANLKDQVYSRRCVSNIFGYRFNILGRIDQSTMNAAAAWIPQSTVGCLINRAYVKIDAECPDVQILLQVHDSLAGQYPIAKAEDCRKQILAKAAIMLPYADPLVIPVGIKTSTKSWGDCE